MFYLSNSNKSHFGLPMFGMCSRFSHNRHSYPHHFAQQHSSYNYSQQQPHLMNGFLDRKNQDKSVVNQSHPFSSRFHTPFQQSQQADGFDDGFSSSSINNNHCNNTRYYYNQRCVFG